MRVRFTRLTIYEIRLPFRFSFKHALAERDETHSLILALETDGGKVGFGEVLPRSYLTNENIESAWQDITTRWWPALREIAPPPASENDNYAISPILSALAPLYTEADSQRKTASYAGIDIAAVDAWARTRRIAGKIFFGAVPKQVRVTAPLGSATGKKLRRLTRLAHWLGFHDYKLKTGLADDLARVRMIRAIIGEADDLRVDANAAWSVNEAIKMAQDLCGAGVSSIEQPISAVDATDAKAVTMLAQVQAAGGLPIMADESLCTQADATALLAADAARIWNVRLAKVGGFSGLLALTKLARARQIELHLGVLVGETGLLAAASRACLGLGEFRHVEFGFPKLLLRKNIFRGGVDGYRGIGSPLSTRLGLGVELKMSALKSVTLRREVLR